MSLDRLLKGERGLAVRIDALREMLAKNLQRTGRAPSYELIMQHYKDLTDELLAYRDQLEQGVAEMQPDYLRSFFEELRSVAKKDGWLHSNCLDERKCLAYIRKLASNEE